MRPEWIEGNDNDVSSLATDNGLHEVPDPNPWEHMTDPAAPPAIPTPEELSRTLHVSLADLETTRETLEAAMTNAMQAESMIRRLGIREASHLLENGSDALPDAGRLQSENNAAFRQIRETLTGLHVRIANVKSVILSLDAELRSMPTA